jgi:hypothetical protein
MGGGRGIPTLIFTCAIVGIGTVMANTKRIIPKDNVFIFIASFIRHLRFLLMVIDVKDGKLFILLFPFLQLDSTSCSNGSKKLIGPNEYSQVPQFQRSSCGLHNSLA